MRNDRVWIALSEQAPTAADRDDFEEIFAYHPERGAARVRDLSRLDREGFTHWKPTGFKVPAAPAEAEAPADQGDYTVYAQVALHIDAANKQEAEDRARERIFALEECSCAGPFDVS